MGAESCFQGCKSRMLEWYVQLRALVIARRIVSFDTETVSYDHTNLKSNVQQWLSSHDGMVPRSMVSWTVKSTH